MAGFGVDRGSGSSPGGVADLAASTGSSLVGFIQSGTGAIARTIEARLRDLVSILDFIPVAEHAAIAAQTSATTLTTYIQAALDAVHTDKRGGLYVPAGLYNTGEINWPGNNIALVGAGSGYGYNSNDTVRTIFKAVAGTTHVFDLVQTGTSEDRKNNLLMGFQVDGNAIATNGIRCSGSNLLHQVRATGCTGAGFLLENLTNSTSLVECAGVSNSGVGLKASGVSATKFSVVRSNFSLNTVGGVNLETGFGVSFEDVTIESNGAYGLRIFRPNTHTNLLGNMSFKSCWLEDPDTVDLIIDAETRNAANGPTRIKFDNCHFSVPVVTQDYADLLCCYLVTFDHCHFDGSTEAGALNVNSTAFNVGLIESKLGRSSGSDGLTTAQVNNVLSNGVRCYARDAETITVRVTDVMTTLISDAEKQRLTATGFSKFSVDGSYADSTGSYHELRSNAANYAAQVSNKHATTPHGLFLYFDASAPNDNIQQFILALDNAATRFSVFSSGAIRACQGTAIPAGGTAGRGVMVSSTANFGVFFGSGAPTLSAAQGSLYIRSDGSSASTRLYVNTDGGTTWTNVTTAA